MADAVLPASRGAGLLPLCKVLDVVGQPVVDLVEGEALLRSAGDGRGDEVSVALVTPGVASSVGDLIAGVVKDRGGGDSLLLDTWQL